jgi:multidrug efflux system membrane fusion protein
VKRAIILILLVAAAAGGFWWFKYHAAAPPATAAPAAADEGTHVTHDEQGNTVISMTDDAQGDAGIILGNPLAGQWNPEVKGYGRVLDPAPLAGLVNELISAQAGAAATSLEWVRQKTLSAQSNTSIRTLQTAAAAAQHDKLAVQSVRDRLTLAWGTTLAGRDDLADFVQLLTARQAVLVRVDLTVGDSLTAPPAGARVVALNGKTTGAKFLSPAADVDPQIQGQGFIFSVQPNDVSLAPGQALTVWLQVPGDPLAGVIVPRDSIVRLEGASWVYLMNKAEGGEAFTRKKIPLDRPTEGGWFVPGMFKVDDYIVTTGAQTLLSEELKAALSPN